MDTPSRTGRTLRVVARTLVVLVSAGALAVAGIGWTLQQHVAAGLVTSDVVAGSVPVAAGAAFTALIVGLDARTDAAGNPLPPAILDALHAGPDEGQLHTDTIILLHVPARTGAPAVAVSIPRDSFVPLAGGQGTHKINSAYGRGLDAAEKSLSAQGVTGAALDRQGREAGRTALVDTVESLTGVQIDHFAEINLAGFVELTEAIGGVPVCLDAAVHDSYSGLDLPAGPQTITGPAALAFVRQRHGLDGGDLDRIARQQAFIAGVTQRLQSAGVLADPTRLGRLLDVATRNVVLDRGWTLDEALGQFRKLSGDGLTLRTIPTGRPDLRTPVDGVAVQVDPDAVRAFVGELVARSDAPAGSPAPPSEPPPTAEVETAGTASAGPTPTTTPTRTTTPTPATTPPQVISADGVPCVP
jgi:LCP family protein required for cell wall assembly